MTESTKTVNFRDFRKALDELNEKYRDTGIQFYDMGSTPWEELVSIGVNWSCKGTQDPSVTIDFAAKLQKAAEDAAGFKYNGHLVSYEG